MQKPAAFTGTQKADSGQQLAALKTSSPAPFLLGRVSATAKMKLGGTGAGWASTVLLHMVFGCKQ